MFSLSNSGVCLGKSEESEENIAVHAFSLWQVPASQYQIWQVLSRLPVAEKLTPVSVHPPVGTSICIHGYRYLMVCLTSIHCRYSRVLVLVACPASLITYLLGLVLLDLWGGGVTCHIEQGVDRLTSFSDMSLMKEDWMTIESQ